METTKKTRTKKTRASSTIDPIEGTIIERPIAAANQAAQAGLGLATQLWTSLEVKYEDYARDGEKVRNQIEGSIDGLQNRISGQIKKSRSKVEKRVAKALNTILDYSPIAKASDVDKLNAKLNKALLEIAK